MDFYLKNLYEISNITPFVALCFRTILMVILSIIYSKIF